MSFSMIREEARLHEDKQENQTRRLLLQTEMVDPGLNIGV
jgi:hypothetical protein